ncbi:hypothetical protein MXB_685, partial [Myxobolus squamalis]
EFYHKIVLGIILLESFDEYLNKIGSDLLTINLQNMTENELTVFMNCLNNGDAHLKYHILSILSLDQRIQELNPELLKCAKFNSIQFLTTPTLLNQYSLVQQTIHRHETTNKLLEAIKAAHSLSEITCDYQKIVNEHELHINTYTVAETIVFISQMERHPNVHAYNFLSVIKNAGISCYIAFIDALFCFEKQLDIFKLQIIVSSYNKAFECIFPMDEIYKYKNHPNFLILFMELAVEIPEIISFTSIPHNVVDISVVYSNAEAELPQNWSSMTFIGLLLKMYSIIPDRVSKLIRNGIITFPDILFLGILQQPRIEILGTTRNILHELLIYYIKTEKSSIEMLKYAWAIPCHAEKLQPLILQSMQEYFTQTYTDINVRVNRIIDVAYTLNAINILLKMPSLAFVVEIAIMAGKRNLIILYSWMNDQFVEYKESFLLTLYSYIQKHYIKLFSTNVGQLLIDSARVIEHASVLDEIFQFLQYHRNLLSLEVKNQIENAFGNYRHIFESATLARCAHDRVKIEEAADVICLVLSVILKSATNKEKFKEIDEFIKRFSFTYTVDNPKNSLYFVIEVLTTINYYAYIPLKDLHAIACMISRLVDYKYIDLQRAVNLIDRILNEYPCCSRFFYMAVTIISCCGCPITSAFRPVSTKWLHSTFFSSLPPFLRYCIEYTHHLGYVPLSENKKIAFEDPQQLASQMFQYIIQLSDRADVKHKSIFYITEIETLSKAIPPFKSPGEPDRTPYSTLINRILNNLTEENVEESAKILYHRRINDYRWISYHIVRERVPTQMQLHRVYRRFIKLIDNHELYWMVRTETSLYIREILAVLEFDNQKKERDLLCTLGFWMGLITIADNKPLIYSEINIKHILIEAGIKSQDDVARLIPFFKSFLSCAKESFIFNINNPWILSICSVLVEIHSRPDIRNVLKFEIEMLVRSLGFNLKVIPMSDYLNIPELASKVHSYLPWNNLEKIANIFSLQTSLDHFNYDSFDVSSSECILDRLNLDHCPTEFIERISETFIVVMEAISPLVSDIVIRSVDHVIGTIINHDLIADPIASQAGKFSKNMTRSITIGFTDALIKEDRFLEISHILQNTLTDAILHEITQLNVKIEKEVINKIVFDVSQDNIDVIIVSIAKLCTEKVIPLMQKNIQFPVLREQSSCNQFNSVIQSPSNENTFELNDTEEELANLVLNRGSVYNEFNEYAPGNNADAITNLASRRLICLKSVDKRLSYDYFTLNLDSIVNYIVDLCRALLYDKSNRGITTEFELCKSLNILDKILSDESVSQTKNDDDLLIRCQQYKPGAQIPEQPRHLNNGHPLDDSFTCEQILRDWVRMYYTKSQSDLNTNFKMSILMIGAANFLINEDTFLSFLKLCFEIMIQLSNEVTENSSFQRLIQIIDSFVYFIVLCIKFYGGPECSLMASKMNFFSRIFEVIISVIDKCSDRRELNIFQQKIYERIVICLLLEISRPETVIASIRLNFIVCILGFLHSLRPCNYPSFSSSFLFLMFQSNLISISLSLGFDSKSASLYALILQDFLVYLKKNIIHENKNSSQLILSHLKIFSRKLLKLTVSNPEFMSYYYLFFLNHVPSECFQLRNIILCAIPRRTSPKFEIENILESPPVFISLTRYVPSSLIRYTQTYIYEQKPINFKDIILSYFDVQLQFEGGTKSGHELLNTYLLYLGSNGASDMISKYISFNVETVSSTIYFDIINHLILSLHHVTRFRIFSSIVNHIRYPSSHSMFFIYTILSVFLSAKIENIQEQIL